MRVNWQIVGFVIAVLLLSCHSGRRLAAESPLVADSIDKLGGDIWAWRAQFAPFTADDVPRIERAGGRRDWSAASISRRREELKQFESRWEKLDVATRPVHEQVDCRLLGSALARARWELDVNPRWKRDPTFYIEQTVTPVLEFIAVPGPFDEARSREILGRLDNIPSIVASAETNLKTPPAPFAKAAIESLSDIRAQLRTMAASIQPVTTRQPVEVIDSANRAAQSLEEFRRWLGEILPNCPQDIAIGREAYNFFVHRVALVPYTPEEMLAIGRLETARSEAFLAYEHDRDKDAPPLARAKNTAALVERAAKDEISIREFLRQHEILTVPSWMQHYTFRPLPDYVRALSGFGETDDFTSATRLRDSATRYVDSPSANLDFFWAATAKDTRPILLHEGVPGHYLQLALSWANEDPIRRHFYDSGPNEGLGFYCEEMMLQFGFFDDSPRTREIVYQFMLLRAIGIEIDMKMATGEFTIEQAAAYLEKHLPLGHEMAMGGATMFATWPGVMSAYQMGKTDIVRFLADSKLKKQDSFQMRAFNDSLWKNGNVPIVLQRWEYLGDSTGIEKLRTLAE